MKKNIEWLKEQIEVMETETSENYPHEQMVEREVVLRLINQLGEPEMLSQEKSINIVLDDLKEYIKEQQLLSQNVGLAHTPAGNDTYYKQYDYVLQCIDEYESSDELQNLLVPKQELPVVPKWFDEWWKDVPKGEGNLLHNIDLFQDELFNSGTRGAYNYIISPDNKKKLLNIIVNELDYEVEEPVYQVSAESMTGGFWFLCKDNDGNIEIGTNKDYYEADWDSLKLTEQEIKDYDKRYWAFAELV